MTPRIACYVRVSTEEQAKEGFSLDAQAEKLRSYASIKGWEVAGEYVDDGQSGRTPNRPAYRRMLEERDRWDTILVLKIDRIHRNSRNFLGMMDDLKRHGKEFVSVTESLDTSTAMGRFVMSIMSGLAQLESEQTGERTRDGMRQKALGNKKKGGLGGPAPYGYRWASGKLVVVPEEAKGVRKVFALARRGRTVWDIADMLNNAGYRTRRGNNWTYWSVREMINNPVYEGKLVWDGIVQHNAHQPLKEAPTA